MKPSSKIILCCRAAFYCAAIVGMGSAAAFAEPLLLKSPADFARGIAAPQQLWRQIAWRTHGRRIFSHHVRRKPSYGVGYGMTPLLSGSFPSGPGGEDESAFEPPQNFYPWPPLMQAPPCVVPLVIKLKPQKPARRLPKVIYGSQSYCPPPVTSQSP
jgi:hypothetical protein